MLVLVHSTWMTKEMHSVLLGDFSGNYVYLEHGGNAASGVGGTAEGGFFREGYFYELRFVP